MKQNKISLQQLFLLKHYLNWIYTHENVRTAVEFVCLHVYQQYQ